MFHERYSRGFDPDYACYYTLCYDGVCSFYAESRVSGQIINYTAVLRKRRYARVITTHAGTNLRENRWNFSHHARPTAVYCARGACRIVFPCGLRGRTPGSTNGIENRFCEIGSSKDTHGSRLCDWIY